MPSLPLPRPWYDTTLATHHEQWTESRRVSPFGVPYDRKSFFVFVWLMDRSFKALIAAKGAK